MQEVQLEDSLLALPPPDTIASSRNRQVTFWTPDLHPPPGPAQVTAQALVRMEPTAEVAQQVVDAARTAPGWRQSTSHYLGRWADRTQKLAKATLDGHTCHTDHPMPSAPQVCGGEGGGDCGL